MTNSRHERFCLLQSLYVGAVTVSLLWFVTNCLYVYVVLHGQQSYRLESAAFILLLLLLPRLWFARPAPGSPRDLSAICAVVFLVLLSAAWLAVFVPLLNFPFLSDDYGFLERYRSLALIVPRGVQFFRPLFAAVFLVLARVGGGSTIPFHVLGLALHLSSACLAYSLAWRLFGRRAPAVAVFAVFLLNPLQLEAVLWASGLQELLWTFFLLAAVRCYVGSQALSAWRTLATFLLVTASLLSKETAACFVLVLPAADVAFFRMGRGRPLWATYSANALLLVAYLAVRSSFVVSIDPQFLVAPSTHFVKQFIGMPYRFFVQPWNAQAVTVPPAIPALASLLVMAFVFAAAMRRRVTVRTLAGPLVVLMTTAPLFGFFYVGADLMAARYLYMPAVGWAFLVAELLVAVLPDRRMLVAAVASVAIASLLALSVNIRPWRLAASLVLEMEAAAKVGTPVAQVVHDWEGRNGVRVNLRDGVPRDYVGVGIFINGYPEFARLHR